MRSIIARRPLVAEGERESPIAVDELTFFLLLTRQLPRIDSNSCHRS